MDVASTSSHSDEAYDFYKMELIFQQAIDPDYLRNNKTNGSKNLRCFPSCSFPMHCERGFCGQPLFAELYIWCIGSETIIDFDAILSKLLIIGEFQPCNNEFDGLKEVVDVDYLLGNIIPPYPLFYVAQRSINFVGDESFPAADDAFDFDNSSLFGDSEPAALVHTKKFVLNLKFESKSWQYSWKSTRCTKETKHAFIVSVLSPASLSSSPSSPSMSQHYFSESSDHSSVAADRPHAPPQHLRRLLQRASQSFTVSCVRRSDKAKQFKKHEKTSVKSMWLEQGILDQTSTRQFTPCVLPGDLPPSPLPQRDEEDEEHCMSITLPSQHHHNHHHCHAHLSRRSLSLSPSSVTVETESIGDVGYKRGSDYLFYGEDDRLLHDVHNTLKNTKTNELAGFSPTLEAAYRSVFGYSA